MSKRNKEKRSGKRRGPLSLESSGRTLRKATPPPNDPIRKMVTSEVRKGVERAVPDYATESENGDNIGESILFGVLQVAGELAACAPADQRPFFRDRAINYFKDAMALEVQDYHTRHVNRVSASEVGKQRQRGSKFAEDATTKKVLEASVNKDVLARLFVDYYVGIKNEVFDMEDEDAPIGAPNMLIYATVEVLADLLAATPERYGDALDNEVIAALPARIAAKRAAKKEPTDAPESDAADGQLQADPLEAVPTGDDERL